MFATTDLTEGEFNRLLDMAVDWQYLIVLAGGMARKSDCEAWMMARTPGLSHSDARTITNTITEGPRYFICRSQGVEWQEFIAGRPAPKFSEYPDTKFEQRN